MLEPSEAIVWLFATTAEDSARIFPNSRNSRVDPVWAVIKAERLAKFVLLVKTAVDAVAAAVDAISYNDCAVCWTVAKLEAIVL